MWLVFAIGAAIAWGLDYSLSEEIFKSVISPLPLLAYEMLLGGILLLPFIGIAKMKATIQILLTNRSAFWLFWGILITFNLGNLLIFCSIEAGKNATLAALVELAYPIFTVLFTLLLFKINHLSVSVIVGGAFVFTGITIIALFSGFIV